ncbi:MAG: bifunctional folylpolyglutamate synthase/dihydrofolate synthase, partial [Mogibacterium sp.]|nr:bifunctional folylpolyglutamate synthase/dihydrofolate synthase [Mogibacterium sp.]
MTIEEALTYINSKSWSQWKLGLSRTIDLLKRVGDPHKDLKFVHIAGTNGKGSTSAMITSILTASGYRVGMYPSPFIETFNERIQINGEMISDDDLCELTEIVKAAGDAMEDHPTHFEIITAIGMLYFKRKRCDVVVLEVGLGGTFDSTNVIDSPELCVITNIGFDHTQYLGETLAEIASNKAGIIKKGSDVVC